MDTTIRSTRWRVGGRAVATFAGTVLCLLAGSQAAAAAGPLCGEPAPLVAGGVTVGSVVALLIETGTPGEYQEQVVITATGGVSLVASQVGGGLSPGDSPDEIGKLFGVKKRRHVRRKAKTYKNFPSKNIDDGGTTSTHSLPGIYTDGDVVLVAVHAEVYDQTGKKVDAWVPGLPIPGAKQGGTYVSCVIPTFAANPDRYITTGQPYATNRLFRFNADYGVLSNDVYDPATTTVELIEDLTYDESPWDIFQQSTGESNNELVHDDRATLSFDAADGSFSFLYAPSESDQPYVRFLPNFRPSGSSPALGLGWGEFRFTYRLTDGFGRTVAATARVQHNESTEIPITINLDNLDIKDTNGVGQTNSFIIPFGAPLTPNPNVAPSYGNTFTLTVSFGFLNPLQNNQPTSAQLSTAIGNLPTGSGGTLTIGSATLVDTRLVVTPTQPRTQYLTAVVIIPPTAEDPDKKSTIGAGILTGVSKID